MTTEQVLMVLFGASGIFGIILKMWIDHSRLAKMAMNQLSEVISKNAEAMTKLTVAVEQNSKVTETASNSIAQHSIKNDEISSLLLKMVKTKKRK